MPTEPNPDQDRRAQRRVSVFVGLVVVYVVVAGITYFDYPRRNTDPPLSAVERHGLELWREYNCQACHQIFGFGGFLGPDLTNRVTDETRDAELEWILVSGSRKMPAFDLPADERAAILAFLRYVNRTGQSQPTPLQPANPIPPTEHFRRIAEAWKERTGQELPPPAQRGLELVSQYGCGGCHQPFAISAVRAPDLSGAAVDRSVYALQKLLDTGRGRMPAFGLPPEEVRDVAAFLSWLADNRRALVRLDQELLGLEEFSWRKVPWFEYR